jgi:hypothetical protein
MKVKLGKRALGQHVGLPGHCSKCIFNHNSWDFCIFKIRCTMLGYFSNCTSEDIFKL